MGSDANAVNSKGDNPKSKARARLEQARAMREEADLRQQSLERNRENQESLVGTREQGKSLAQNRLESAESKDEQASSRLRGSERHWAKPKNRCPRIPKS